MLGLSMRNAATQHRVFSLAALTLDVLTIAEDQVTGTKVGTITGNSPDSTIAILTQSNASMFAQSGRDINVGATALDFETVPSPTITLREINDEANNSPRDTIITITVTDVLYGAEMLVNGSFASAASWTMSGTNPPAISAGKLVPNVLAVAGKATQTLTVAPGTYHLVYTIDSITTGSVTPHVGNAAGTARTTAGTFTQDIVVASGGNIDFTFALTDAVVDNASLKLLI